VTLQDVFDQLTYGELFSMHMGGTHEGGVPPEERPRVASHVNMGLKSIYTRFWLSSREVIIQLYDHIQIYKLDSRYAITNKLSPEIPKYIIDSEWDKFDDDLLKIETVHDEGGRQMFLNDKTEMWSLFTPSYNTIQIPFPERHNSMTVHYRAGHRTVRCEKDTDPSEIEINLPEPLVEALLLYVGARALHPMGSPTDQENMTYMQAYEQACQRVEKANLYVEPFLGNVRLEQGGWV
jgi:hypothetical protein